MKALSRAIVRSFPSGIQDGIGYAFYVAQTGETSPKAKPLHGLGSGVMEIAVHDAMPDETPLHHDPSSGNVFADLGLPAAAEHILKAGLVLRIDRTIRARRLTQTAAAAILDIDQPEVSAMLAGHFRGYSVERLMRFLVALGHDVEIVVKPRKRGPASLRVA